jgi:hypothetical protein
MQDGSCRCNATNKSKTFEPVCNKQGVFRLESATAEVLRPQNYTCLAGWAQVLSTLFSTQLNIYSYPLLSCLLFALSRVVATLRMWWWSARVTASTTSHANTAPAQHCPSCPRVIRPQRKDTQALLAQVAQENAKNKQSASENCYLPF